MPLPFPIRGQGGRQDLLLAGVQIEVKAFGAILLDPELIVTLREEITAGNVVLPGQDVQRKGQFVTGNLHGIGPVHLHPLVLLVEIDGFSGRALDQFGLAHDMSGNRVRRLVLQRTDRLFETRADEIPDGTAHELGMRVDHLPEIIHGAAAVTGDRQIFVHEGRTHVLGIQAVADFMFDRDGIARADDILGGMLGRIAAVHPETGRIQALAFLDYFRDVIAFTTLVTGAPE